MNNKNNKILYGVGGIVIGIILILVLAPTMRNGGMMNWNNNSMQNQNRNTNMEALSNIDKHFIEQMIPHHEGAIDMAKLALRKATRPEIKTLAGAIIEAQDKEINDMEVWYKSWFGKNISNKNTDMMGGGMMSGGGMHMGGEEEVIALEKAADFDKAFIEAMIPHHQLAIMMANMMKSGTDRPEMLTLADNIIESQSQEIEQMQNWYKEWYK